MKQAESPQYPVDEMVKPEQVRHRHLNTSGMLLSSDLVPDATHTATRAAPEAIHVPSPRL